MEKDGQKLVKSAKSQAASIAAEYRKQGMSQSEAMKKAWSEIERSSESSSKRTGDNISNNIGGATTKTIGKLGVRDHFGIEMEKPDVVCRYSAQNNQCIGRRCPFSGAGHGSCDRSGDP